jgi:hypothetical protein
MNLNWMGKLLKIGAAAPWRTCFAMGKDDDNMRLCGTDPFLLYINC